MNEGTGGQTVDLVNGDVLKLMGVKWVNDKALGIKGFARTYHLTASDKNQLEGRLSYSIVFACLRTGVLIADDNSTSRVFDKNGGVMAVGFNVNQFSIWEGEWKRITYTMPANVIIHGAITYDGTIIRFYINGSQVGTSVETGPTGTGIGGLYVGQTDDDDANNRQWPGTIYFLEFYDDCLNAGSIMQHYEDFYAFIKKPTNMALKWFGIPAAPPAGGGGVPTQIIINITQYISDEVYAWSIIDGMA